MKDIIFEKLQTNFQPEILEVIDNSHLHRGHQGVANYKNNSTHFLVKIKAKQFNQLSQLTIHRKINQLLTEEFKNGIHALEIKVLKD